MAGGHGTMTSLLHYITINKKKYDGQVVDS